MYNPRIKVAKNYHTRPLSIDSLIIISSLVRDWQRQTLVASHWRLYCPISKGGVLLFDDKEIEMTPRSCYLIPPFTDFGYTFTQDFHKVYAHFFVSPISLQAGIYSMALAEDRWDALQLLVDTPRNLAAARWFTDAILASLEYHIDNSKQPSIQDKRIRTTLNYMTRKINESPSNEQLAQVANLSVGAFPRVFRKATGMSAQQFLLKLKLERACHQLLHTDLSIEEIAEDCGFHDRYHFSKLFKRQWRIPPAQYRREIMHSE